MGFIRKFMLFFGPVSSVFGFATFGTMLWVFHAGPALFRSGWFVESLAAQTLVIFVIRTRRSPFFRSRPSTPRSRQAHAGQAKQQRKHSPGPVTRGAELAKPLCAKFSMLIGARTPSRWLRHRPERRV